MHRIFDSYNHARISYTLKKPELTDIHLRHMKESMAMAQKNIPEKDRKGHAIDKAKFMAKVATLQSTISDLRGAVKYEAPLLAELFAADIFNICVACHAEMKFDTLFQIPRHMTLYGEYMHKVSEHVDLARMDKESEAGIKQQKQHIKLLSYYLDLLRTAIPAEGPSGVILDKDAFDRQIQDIQGQLKEIAKSEKRANMEPIRETLNGLCVTCHEPERIR